MNKEKLQEYVKSCAKQFENLKAVMITPEEVNEQISLSKEYENSSDKEGFLKSRKGQRLVLLTCEVGNLGLIDAIKLIREKNGIIEPCPDWNGYDE